MWLSVPGMGLGRGWAVLLMLGLLLGACGPPVSARDPRCFNACAEQKDACLLHASTAVAVRECDQQGDACGRQCH